MALMDAGDWRDQTNECNPSRNYSESMIGDSCGDCSGNSGSRGGRKICRWGRKGARFSVEVGLVSLIPEQSHEPLGLNTNGLELQSMKCVLGVAPSYLINQSR
ncbi:unnamed protein product, partial [Ilex paraguariensis]